MKVAYDATHIQDQFAFRGIGRCAREILKQFMLKALSQPQELTLAVYGFKEFEDILEELPLNDVQKQMVLGSTNIEFHSLGEIIPSSPLGNLKLFYGRTRTLLQEIQPDLVFMPYFERIVPREWKTAVVVHDAIPLKNGRFSDKGILINVLKGAFYRWAWKRQVSAFKLLAVSRSTKQDAVAFGLQEKNFAIAYNGISENFLTAIAEDESVQACRRFDVEPQKFFLYDSGVEKNKRPELLLSIFTEFRKALPDHKLVITGRSFTRAGGARAATGTQFIQAIRDIESTTNEQIFRSIVFTDAVSEGDLRALTESARAYINMSGDEGFGFGPLQAMAVATPAILAADNNAFIELSSQYSIQIDPAHAKESAKEAIVALERVSKDSLVEASAYARKFTWERNFEQIWTAITT